MAEFESILDKVFRTSAPPQAARDHFADLDQVRAAITQGEHFEVLEPGVLRIRLKPQNQGTTTFVGRYTVRYTVQGDDVRWATEGDSNMVSEGRATFRPDGAGASIAYRHVIRLDIPVNRVVAAVLSPVVKEITKRSLEKYVERMLASLERRPVDLRD